MPFDQTEENILHGLKAYVSEGGNINTPDLLQESIITRALNFGYNGVVEFLIDNDADLLSIDSDGSPAILSIFFRAKRNLIEAASRSFKRKPIDKDVIGEAFGCFINHYKSKPKVDIGLLDFIIESFNIDMKTCEVDNESVVFSTIKNYNAVIFRRLLRWGLALNVVNLEGRTPIEVIDSLIAETHRGEELLNFRESDNLQNIKELLEHMSTLVPDDVRYISDSWGIVKLEPYKEGMEDGYIFHDFDGKFICFKTHKEMETGFPKSPRVPAISDFNNHTPINEGDSILTLIDGKRLSVNEKYVSEKLKLVRT
jgi:hypothetical protein